MSGSYKSTHQCRSHRFDPRVGKVPWRRKWQPTPEFLSGKSQGQRSCGVQSMGLQRVGYDLVTKEQRILKKKTTHKKPPKDFNRKEMYQFRHWECGGTVLAFMTQMMSSGLSVSGPTHHQEEAGSLIFSLLCSCSSPTGPGVLGRLQTSWYRFPRQPQKEPTLPTPRSWASGLRNRETTHLCSFSHTAVTL